MERRLFISIFKSNSILLNTLSYEIIIILRRSISVYKAIIFFCTCRTFPHVYLT
jgi:hypothetical protein